MISYSSVGSDKRIEEMFMRFIDLSLRVKGGRLSRGAVALLAAPHFVVVQLVLMKKLMKNGLFILCWAFGKAEIWVRRTGKSFLIVSGRSIILLVSALFSSLPWYHA